MKTVVVKAMSKKVYALLSQIDEVEADLLRKCLAAIGSEDQNKLADAIQELELIVN